MLEFEMPFTFKRFKQDKFQRFLFPIRALICATALFWAVLYFGTQFSNPIVFLLGLLSQASAFFLARIKFSNLHVRLCLILTEYFLQTTSYSLFAEGFLLLHLAWFNLFTFALSMCSSSPPIDVLLVYVWYHHLAISVAFSIFRYLVVSEQTFGRTFCEILTIGITTTLFAFVERAMKEEWVLFDSFKRAQKIYMKLIDQLPVPTFVTDFSGRVIYSNSAGKALHDATARSASATGVGHGWNFLELVYADHKQTVEDLLKKIGREAPQAVEVPLLNEAVDPNDKAKEEPGKANPNAPHLGLNEEITKRGTAWRR